MSVHLSVMLLAFGLGIVAGLRSMTAPALVAWAAHLGVLHLAGTGLAFMGKAWVVALFTLGALGEFVADLLPNTPARTAAVGLGARICTGGLCGACIGAASGEAIVCAIAGAVGAVAGAYGGYHARAGLVKALRAKDAMIAIPEDLVAIGLGLFLLSQI